MRSLSFYVALFFLGVLIRFDALTVPVLMPLLLLAGCVLYINGSERTHKQGCTWTRPPPYIVMGCISLMAGFLFAGHAQRDYKSHQLTEVVNNSVVTGQVVSLPQWIRHSDGHIIGQRFVFEVERIQPELPQTPRRVRLNYYFSPVHYSSTETPKSVIQQGQTGQLVVKLKPPKGFNNGVGFNYERWLFTQGIHATGYVKEATLMTNAPPHSWSGVRQTLLTHFASIGVAGQLHAAIVLGHKRAIPQEDYNLFVRTGTAHLFAISGLHVGMVASIGYGFGYGVGFILGCVLGRFRWGSQAMLIQPNLHLAGLWGALGLAGLYCLLAGFTLPTQRAFIMLSCVVLFGLMGKKAISVDTVLVSFLLVLMMDAKAIYSVGFWLSFMAVGWILYLAHVCPFKRKITKALWVYLLLPVLLAPINVYCFGQSATLGALANMVLIPLFSLCVLPLALLDAFLGLFSITINWIESLSNALYEVCLAVLRAFDVWGVQTAYLTLTQAVLMSAGLALCLLPYSLGGRGLLQRLGLGVLCVSCVSFSPPRIEKGTFEAHVLDVGQGLSVVIRTQQNTLVYDTGDKFRTGFTVANATLVPFLRSKQVNTVDTLVISHSDRDHNGGTRAVLNQFEVSAVLAGQPTKPPFAADDNALSVTACQKGQSWEWDRVAFTVLWPDGASKGYDKDNNRSCVLLIRGEQQSLLITGDIEARVEAILAQHKALSPVDALVVSHHGSQSSTTTAFLKALRPRYALISAGQYNRFHHPSPKVMERLNHAGVTVLSTSTCGRIDYLNKEVRCNNPR